MKDNYYDPYTIFDNNSEMQSLAPSFAQTRYSENNPYGIKWDNNYYSNAAAVEIYNKNHPYGTQHYRPQFFQGMSDNKKGALKHVNWGHSEPRMMQKALDHLITDPNDFRNQNFNKEILPPYKVTRSDSPRDKDVEILYNLINNAPDYKRYLEKTDRKLNALSELSMCQGTNNNGCRDFMQRISPDGSKLGHTVSSNYYGEPREQAVERGVRELGPGYEAYMKKKNQEALNPFNKPSPMLRETQKQIWSLSPPASPYNESFTPLQTSSSSSSVSDSEYPYSPVYFPRTPYGSSSSSSSSSAPTSPFSPEVVSLFRDYSPNDIVNSRGGIARDMYSPSYFQREKRPVSDSDEEIKPTRLSYSSSSHSY